MHRTTAILLIICPDRRGLVAAVAQFLADHGANILHADQHIDDNAKLFFMRVEWDLEGFDLCEADFADAFAAIAEEHAMRWQLHLGRRLARVAIFCSRQDHCLADLLHRHRAGELACDIPLVISNHADNRALAAFHGIRYEQIEVLPRNKAEAEADQLALLSDAGIDLIVLARYMQVLSGQFIARYANRIINIHHSFLPAFVGARPYQHAFERGVKLIGATSHYVTTELDNGPIIEQDVERVSHRDQVDDLVQKGRDIERVVLARAVKYHLAHRILTYGNKTVVFD